MGFNAHCASLEEQVGALLAQMTLDEKIGQMVQVDSGALKTRPMCKNIFSALS